MITVPILIRWKDTYRAERALGRAVWLRANALVPLIILILEHCAALAAIAVLLSILALVKQVVVQGLDLDDLLALPAGREHGTFAPVVDIYRLSIKRLVILSTELANLLIDDSSSVVILWRC